MATPKYSFILTGHWNDQLSVVTINITTFEGLTGSALPYMSLQAAFSGSLVNALRACIMATLMSLVGIGTALLLDDVCLQNFDFLHGPIFLIRLDQTKLLHCLHPTLNTSKDSVLSV